MRGDAPRRTGCLKPRIRPERLVHFEDASSLDDRRPFLAFRKAGGFLAIDIDASEFLAVGVIDGDLPVAVLPAAVAAHSRAAPFPFGFFLISQEAPLKAASIPV